MTGNKAVAVVPVRVQSTRLPRKALLRECGKMPLFLHTVQQARKAKELDEVIVATDDPELMRLAEQAGVSAILTSPRARSGSERCAMALRDLPDAEIIINVQGDWPEVPPEDLDRLVLALRKAEGFGIATLACALDRPADFTNPHVVKVVTGAMDQALYFSRAPIPAAKDSNDAGGWQLARRHIGVYAFTRAVLEGIPKLPESALESAEGLEQLRWLASGIGIAVLASIGRPRGIETRADYEAFLERLTNVSTTGVKGSGRDPT